MDRKALTLGTLAFGTVALICNGLLSLMHTLGV